MTSDQIIANAETDVLQTLFDKASDELQRRGETVSLDFTKLVREVEGEELFSMWQEIINEMERRNKFIDN